MSDADASETGVRPGQPVVSANREDQPPVRRGRWRRRLAYALVGLFLLLAALVAGAPYLASRKPVWTYALGEANTRLVGSVDLSGLSLGWGGPLEARGIKIVDADKREVLRVDRVSCAGGLWGLLTGGLNFGDVLVEAPKAQLYVNEANEISLIQALQLKEPSPPDTETKPLPEVHGKLVFNGGAVRAERENGPSYEITGLNAKVNVDTLARITADLALRLADGVPVTAVADIKGLAAEGELRPMSATGTLKLATGGDVALGPISELFSPGNRLDGTISLKVDAAGDAENVKADVVANIIELQTATRAATKAAPVNLGLTAAIQRTGPRLAAKANLSGDAGSADAEATYRHSDKPISLSLDRILTALQTGESIGLPDFTLDMTGDIDLARLGQAVPEILHLKEGLELTGGKLEIAKLAVRGGEHPSAGGDLKLTEVTATEAGRPVRVEPMTLNFDAALVAGQGLRIALAELKSSFAEVTAKGAATDIQAAFRANLSRLQQEIGQIVDLSGVALAGDVAGTLEVKRQGAANDLQADFKADATGLKIAKTAGASATVSLGVAGQVQRQGDNLTARTNLSGDAGTAEIGLTYKLSGTPPDLDAERVLSAALTGESLTLPDFTLTAAGSVDLARLANALPELLRIKPGQEITGGQLEIVSFAAHGGERPAAKGNLKLSGVTATNAGQAVRVEPIDIGFDASLAAGQGLQIVLAELKSGFAELSAQGTASNLKTAFRADLSRLHAELGQVVDLGDLTLAGEVSGYLELAKASDERLDVTIGADATGLRYASGDRVLDVQRATLRQGGHLTLKDRRAIRLDVAQFDADLDGQVALSASGWFDLAGGGFRGDVEVKRGELGYASARLESLGIDALAGYAGGVVVKAFAERPAEGQPLLSNGSFVASNLQRDGASAIEGDATMEWKNLHVSADGSSLSADLARLQSSAGDVEASGIKLQTSGPLEANANLKASADLARVMTLAAMLGDMEAPPDLAGQLGLDARVATSGGAVTFNGKGGVDKLEIGAGEKTIREERADFEFDGKLEDPKQRITLTKFRLKSKPLTAEVGGTVDEYKSECILALKGRYDASWEELTALLHELVPDTAETIIVAGKSGSEFEINGPMRNPNVAPQFRSVKSDTEVGWAKADLVGVEMGKANLAPTLQDGRLVIPQTTIPAADGKVNVAGTIDFAPADPTLNIKGKLPVLENVAVSEIFSSTVLGRINPIFQHLVKIDGRVFLTVQDVSMPLGESMKTSGSGTGVLDLGQIKIQPGGFMAELLALGGIATGDMYPVQVGKVNLVIKNGRIYYDNFTLSFPNDFDLKFRGSVGFDSTLDLVISIPVRSGMLQRLGMKGPTLESLKPGSDLRVELPLSGTRESPRLDFSKVDVASLLKGMLPTSPDDVIKGLLDGLQPLAPPPEVTREERQDKRPEKRPEKREPRRPRERREAKPREQPKAEPKEEPKKEPTSQPKKRRATRRP